MDEEQVMREAKATGERLEAVDDLLFTKINRLDDAVKDLSVKVRRLIDTVEKREVRYEKS